MNMFRKNCIFGLLVTILMFTIAIPTYAMDSTIHENPNIRFIIEGSKEELSQTPIIINERSLVPLRALLLKLDVSNDDIYRNGVERSITINKDETQIYMKIGSIYAKVNGEEVILDAAPVIYNDNTYIPVRFVSQALEKKVVWDNDTSSILIRNQADYSSIEEIFRSCVNAITNFKSAEINSQSNIRYYGTIGEAVNKKLNIPNDFRDNTKIKVIKDPIQLYMGKFFQISGKNNGIWDLVSTLANREMYINQSGVYVKLLGKWIRHDFNSQQKVTEEKEAYKYVFDIVDIQGDKVYAGLKLDTSLSDDSNIVLRGDLALMPLLEKLNQSGTPIKLSGNARQDFSLVIYIDRKTYLPVRRIITFDIYYEENGKSFGIEGSEDCSYSFNSSNTVIQVPREATEGFKLF